MMIRRICFAALAATLCHTGVTAGKTVSAPLPATVVTAVADTLDQADEEEGDTAVKSRRNVAKEFNALKYIMERRYRRYGDEFTKAWDDHLFIELGAGLQHIVPPSDNYELVDMTQLHLGVGKQFNRLHTARLSLNFTTGYLKKINYGFNRYGLAADWVFSLSSYFGGYKPSRLLDVSTVLGAGAQYTDKEKAQQNSLAAELHAGLQLRFFAGPQAYVSLEPYVGLVSDNIDESATRNWRRRDVFYGANLNFVYYLHNNLSPEERMRFVKKHIADNDSMMPDAWRAPWFFEASAGLRMVSSATLSNSETLGHAIGGAVGKWFSPAVGARLGLAAGTTTWLKEVTPATKTSPEVVLNRHNQNLDLRLEALINPFGFLPSFRWDAPAGAYITAGGGVGMLNKSQRETLRCQSTFLTAGLHLWAKLTNDLHLFVEPQYTRYSYKIPYSNVDWAHRYNDNGWTLNVGLQISTRSRSYRSFVSGKAEYLASRPHFVVGLGVGGGFNLTHSLMAYGKTGLGYNAMTALEYHFNDISAVRLAFEYMTLSGRTWESATYIDRSYPGEETSKKRTVLYDRHYGQGIVALNYMVNMSNLTGGFDIRRFEAEAFAGPVMILLLNNSRTLAGGEVIEPDHELVPAQERLRKCKWGANAGIKLRYNLWRGLSLTFTPQIYVLGAQQRLPGINFAAVQVMETFNFGVQYSL